jgi:hypothetical protein
MSLYYDAARGSYQNTVSTGFNTNSYSYGAGAGLNSTASIWSLPGLNTNSNINTTTTTKNNDNETFMQMMMMLLPLLLDKKNEKEDEVTSEKIEISDEDEDDDTVDETDGCEDCDDVEGNDTIPEDEGDENCMDGTKAAAVIADRFNDIAGLSSSGGLFSGKKSTLTRADLEKACSSGDHELADAANWWLNNSAEYSLMEMSTDKSQKQDGKFSLKDITSYAAAKEGQQNLAGKEMNAVTATQVLKVNMGVIGRGDDKASAEELSIIASKTTDPILKAALEWWSENPDAFGEMEANDGTKLDDKFCNKNLEKFISDYATA